MSSEWQMVKLKEFSVKIASGATPRGGNKVYLHNGTYSLIRSQNVYNNGFHKDGLVYIDEIAAKKLKNVEIHEKDLLLNITGDSVARVCIAPKAFLPARVNQHVAIIRLIHNEFDYQFVKYYLITSQMQNYMLSLASTGGTRNALTKGMIENFSIPKPPFLIQKKISNVLSNLDAKIELNQKINQTLESIAQAIFKSWFVDFDPVHAKANVSSKDEYDGIAKELGISREILDLFPSEFEESELGLIPKGWGFSNISDFITVVKGTSYKSTELQPSSTALITLKSFLRGGGYRLDGLKPFIGKYKAEQLVKPGELVIAYTDVTQNADVIGKPAIVIKDSEVINLVASLDVGIIRIIKKHFLLGYLYNYFKTELFQNYILGYTSGTTVLHLSKSWVEHHVILTPPKQIIDKFEKFCINSFKRIDATVQETKTLEKIKNELLPKLLSGDLDVSNLNFGPEHD